MLTRRRPTASARATRGREVDGTQVTWDGPHSVEPDGKWPDARLWWPHDPHRYEFRAYVMLGDDIVDQKTVWFGFREVTTDGRQLYLDGVPLFLRADSATLDGSDFTQESVDVMANRVSWLNVNCLRLHYSQAPQLVYEWTDEAGIMVLPQTSLVSGAALATSEEFRRNYYQHLEEVVRENWKHPSLIIRSTDNEAT